jgi:hypothetical protein
MWQRRFTLKYNNRGLCAARSKGEALQVVQNLALHFLNLGDTQRMQQSSCGRAKVVSLTLQQSLPSLRPPPGSETLTLVRSDP